MPLDHLAHNHSFDFADDAEFFHHVIDTIHSVDIAEICHTSDLLDALSGDLIVTVITLRDMTAFWICFSFEIVHFHICFRILDEISFTVF